MGIELLTEDEYRSLQELGTFDLKTSSWVKTPAGIRKLGGALFCDRRYNTVFTYHNGAESYYAAGIQRFCGSEKASSAVKVRNTILQSFITLGGLLLSARGETYYFGRTFYEIHFLQPADLF